MNPRGAAAGPSDFVSVVPKRVLVRRPRRPFGKEAARRPGYTPVGTPAERRAVGYRDAAAGRPDAPGIPRRRFRHPSGMKRHRLILLVVLLLIQGGAIGHFLSRPGPRGYTLFDTRDSHWSLVCSPLSVWLGEPAPAPNSVAS